MPKRPRIAVLGFILESNRFAPPVKRPDFERVAYFEGGEILDEVRKPYPAIDESMTAFVKTMDESGDWEPVPDRKSTRLNSSHSQQSRMPSSA